VTPVPCVPYRAGYPAPMNTPAANNPSRRGRPPTVQSLDIQAFTYEQRHGLLPLLTSAFSNCGGWMLERKTLSPTNMEFRIEIQLRAILDLYAAIVATGVELNRASHQSLTGLCNRRRHLRLATELGQIVAIRLELNFLDEMTLHSLLATGSALA
jgi:hypothetical protein